MAISLHSSSPLLPPRIRLPFQFYFSFLRLSSSIAGSVVFRQRVALILVPLVISFVFRLSFIA